MQYCYNFEDILDQRQSLYGVCVELSNPYIDGQIVTRNERQYRVYKCAQNFFQVPDRAFFFGDPQEGIEMHIDEYFYYTFSNLTYNGSSNLLSTPKTYTLNQNDYQHFRATAEGFNFEVGTWDFNGINSTTIFINCLNDLFISNNMPMRAVMWASDRFEDGEYGPIGKERVCILSRIEDSFLIEFEKDIWGINQFYGYSVDYPTRTIGIDFAWGYIYELFEDTVYRFYLWRSEDDCPCNRGTYCYTMQHCRDIQKTFSFCSTSYMPYVGQIVFLQSEPNEYYKLIFNGENTCICDRFLDPWEIGLSIYEDCIDAYKVDNILVQNCLTNEYKEVTIDSGYLNSECTECNAGFVYNEELQLCEKIEVRNIDSDYELKEITKAPSNIDYTNQNAFIYPINTNYPIVTNIVPSFHYEDSLGNTINPIETLTNPWINITGSNGRLNYCGVEALSSFGGSIFISICINSLQEKDCYIGIVGGYIKLNNEYINNSVSAPNNNWYIFPLKLRKGLNILEFGFDNVLGFEIYDATLLQLSTLTTVSEIESYIIHSSLNLIGKKALQSEDPLCVDFMLNTCSEIPFCQKVTYEDPLPCLDKVFRFENYPCDCFKFVDFIDNRAEYCKVIEVYEECDDCLSGVSNCATAERTTAFSSVIKMPNLGFPDRGFKECCYLNLVLASLNNSSKEYNDFNSFYYLRQTTNDYCHFTLIQLSTGDNFALDNLTYGSFYDFGDISENVNLTYYRLEWKEVLRLLGSGSYQIKKEFSVAGIQFTEYSNTYTLEEYSNSLADGTIRLESRFNGFMEHLNIDFNESNFSDTLRIKGQFGFREPEYTQDNLVNRTSKVTQISISQENKYDFISGVIPSCITEYLFDFLLFGDELLINDYNSNSHTYKYVNYPIVYDGNNGTTYFANNRGAVVSLKFTDRYKNKRKINC